MGNLLQSHIVRRSLGEDSLLQLCGYKKPHPLEDKIMIHASMKPEHATDKLVSQKLQMLSTFMIEQLDEISKELNDLLASAEEVM
jgi:DNA-directed RNA polymerase subunit L